MRMILRTFMSNESLSWSISQALCKHNNMYMYRSRGIDDQWSNYSSFGPRRSKSKCWSGGIRSNRCAL